MDRLQHVVLQRQVPTHILFLKVTTQKQRFDLINCDDRFCTELREGAPTLQFTKRVDRAGENRLVNKRGRRQT